MQQEFTAEQLLYRDGTSQAARHLAALDPASVALDERSLQDLLAFAGAYARELRYVTTENGAVVANGDWRAFLPPTLDLDDVVAFMQQPEQFPPLRAQNYRQPHFVLFLTFLHLLRHAQAQMNTLTRRHLDFVYQQVLRMGKQPGRPDQVHVLVDLAPATSQLLLPAGTRLAAGQDNAGEDRFYQTDQDVMLNHAQIAGLRSLFADKRLIDIRTAREGYDGPKDQAVMKMLEIALGAPNPGDSLPLYPDGRTVNYPLLQALQALVNFTGDRLFLSFADLHQLLRLKGQRDQADEEWQQINAILAKAGRTRDPNYRHAPQNPRAFLTNLKAALGNPPDFDQIFDGIPEVDSIDDAYEKRARADLMEPIRARIQARLYLPMSDFTALMQSKVRIDNEWRAIYQLLAEAGQRRRQANSSVPPLTPFPVGDPKDADAFARNLAAALGADLFAPLTGITNLDEYYAALLQVEQFFFMSAEGFATLMATAQQTVMAPATAGALAEAWRRVYALLAEAHKKKVFAARRAQLQSIREAQGFTAMLAFAAGDDQTQTGLSPLERLLELIRNPQDTTFLTQINDQVQTGQPIDDATWARVYTIVELAQRGRPHFGEPVAQRVEWRNLYAAADATAVRAALGLATDSMHPRWRTFGQTPSAVTPDDQMPTTVGWAITSPLLALSQGQRTITLTLVFQGATEEFAKTIQPLLADPPFQVELTTDKAWITPTQVTLTSGTDQGFLGKSDKQDNAFPALQWQVTLADTLDPIAPLPAANATMSTPWPVLRLRLRQIGHYEAFAALHLLRTHLQVNVTGLTPQQLQNDETTLEPKKPFEPFGVRAVAGAHFYLGHPELIGKKLDSLVFHLEWMGVPKALKSHYKNYAAITATNDFTTRISLRDHGRDRLLVPAAPLFADLAAADKPQTITVAALPAALALIHKEDLDAQAVALRTTQPLLTWPRYLQWELNAPDFQQEAYPAVAAAKAVELAVAIANKKADATVDAGTSQSATPPAGSSAPKAAATIDAGAYQVNPPYTPKLKTLTLDYTASSDLNLAAAAAGAPGDQLFHIHPFGYSELPPLPAAAAAPFLPAYSNEGELYLGLGALAPPQPITLLFQMAEGSADPDLPPTPVEWSYLSANRWVSLDNGNVLQDSTHGLLNTGLVTLRLPPPPADARPSTLLPPGLTWLRIAIPRHSNSVCDTVAIHTQAVTATLVDQPTVAATAADGQSWAPLPAETIQELAEPLPAVAALRQPYTSYGGRRAEQDQTFYTRISERLRHKARALTLWDYEHLVLQQFPQLYKAKCLPAALDRPGQVELVVIPDIRNKLPFNPFEPKAPADLLAAIQSYLAAHSPAFATITVKNATYVAVKVRVAVRFHPAYQTGYAKQLLNEELNRFLAPWAYDEGADIVIGGRIYANVIINFMEERPYVDYVAQIKLFASEDGRPFTLAQPDPDAGYWVETTRPDGILVAARHHEIDLISEVDYSEADFTGINYMKIELDFIVG
ncbi:MAG: baseplate J/gp47 family protein [Caldilineaceae bacterium]